MVKRVYKKQKAKVASDTSFLSIIFKIVLIGINFFVSIGEATRTVFSSPLKFYRRIVESIIDLKKRLFPYKKAKLPKKNLVVSAPVVAKISAKRQKKRNQFNFAHFKVSHFNIPHYKLPALPKVSLPHVELPTFKVSLPKVNTRKLSKRTRAQMTSFRKLLIVFVGTLLKYFLAFLKLVFRIIVRILGFLLFLLKKPFEFLNTLLTAQLKFFLFGVLICALFFITREFHDFVISLPSPREIGKVNYSLATQLNDRNGQQLYEIYRDEKRTPIEISTLPKYVAQASIAIEDKDFYSHKGVSIVSGILRAANETLFKGDLQGGSTITQQLVKTALLTPERTVTRKIKEIILALWTEQMYTKDQILQMYLNQVPYGGAAYGIQEAAKTYFGKDAKDLTIAEAALLAGLPQAPSDYSPFVNPALAIARRNDVLLKMKEQKYITESEYEAARSTTLDIVKPEVAIKAPHFVFYVKSQLEQQLGTRMVEQGGLKVTTTLDLDIQQNVEKILKDEIARQHYLNVNNGAVLVTDPSTGEILAMAGSVDYFQDPYGAFNVTTAERQPGSSLKPLLYSLALQKGFTAASIIPDTPTTFVIPGAEPYHPSNYDNKFHGNVTMRMALANSYNIPAIRTLYNVGIQPFVDYMKSLGITTWNDPSRYVLPMAIGGVEVKMIDEATAYGALADMGAKVSLTGVEKVQDSKDQTLSELHPEKTQVMPPGAAYIISDILSDNQARTATFGPGSQLEIPGYKVAVKTGTTDSKKDNLTYGYTPEFLVSVWIGNNDNTPMNPAIESGATGASSLWHRVMEYLLKNKAKHPNEWYAKPDDVVEKSCGGRTELFITGTENSVNCNPITPTRPPNLPTQQQLPPDIQKFLQQRSNGGNGNNYNGDLNRYKQR